MSRCEDEQMWRWADVKISRCEDEKMWRWEDVKMSRCEDEQMWRWADVKMSRCEDEKMWRWEGVKMSRCEDGKVWRWADVKMSRCEDEKMWRWEGVKMSRCEDGKVWRWADVKMRGCEDERMWRWADVKMRGCEDEMWRWDVKMRRCFTDPHYWKNPALRRSREKMAYAQFSYTSPARKWFIIPCITTFWSIYRNNSGVILVLVPTNYFLSGFSNCAQSGIVSLPILHNPPDLPLPRNILLWNSRSAHPAVGLNSSWHPSSSRVEASMLL